MTTLRCVKCDRPKPTGYVLPYATPYCENDGARCVYPPLAISVCRECLRRVGITGRAWDRMATGTCAWCLKAQVDHDGRKSTPDPTKEPQSRVNSYAVGPVATGKRILRDTLEDAFGAIDDWAMSFGAKPEFDSKRWLDRWLAHHVLGVRADVEKFEKLHDAAANLYIAWSRGRLEAQGDAPWKELHAALNAISEVL